MIPDGNLYIEVATAEIFVQSFFFNDTATTEIYTLSLHDALPIEHRMVGPLLRGNAHAERDPTRDFAHDRLGAAERVEISPGQLRAGGLVTAADVVTHAGGRHVALVSDATADRLRVARVMIGAEDAELGVACLHATLELLEASLVHCAEGLDLHRSIARDREPHCRISWRANHSATQRGLSSGGRRLSRSSTKRQLG